MRFPLASSLATMITTVFLHREGPNKIKKTNTGGGLSALRFGSRLGQHIFAGSVALAMAQFTAIEIGQIKAHAYHGMSGTAISRILFKPKSTSGRLNMTLSEHAVQDAMRKLQHFPQWRGERDEGSGRPRETRGARWMPQGCRGVHSKCPIHFSRSFLRIC